MPAPLANNGVWLNVLLVAEESARAQTLRLLAQSQHRVWGVLELMAERSTPLK